MVVNEILCYIAYKQIFLKFTDHADQQLLAEDLLGEKLIVSVSLVNELQDALNDMIGTLNLVVWVLIAFAVFVNLGMFYKLKQIDIIESLKSVE